MNKYNNIPYNAPELCAHFDKPNRCAAGYFHDKCTLCGSCIRCPKYEPRNGITYDIINDDEIASNYSPEYLFAHVIDSLKRAFANNPAWLNVYAIDYGRTRMTINDVADPDSMLDFAIVRESQNRLNIKFLGRIKG